MPTMPLEIPAVDGYFFLTLDIGRVPSPYEASLFASQRRYSV